MTKNASCYQGWLPGWGARAITSDGGRNLCSSFKGLLQSHNAPTRIAQSHAATPQRPSMADLAADR